MGSSICLSFRTGTVFINRTVVSTMQNTTAADLLSMFNEYCSFWAWCLNASTPIDVQGMTLNCIHIFIVTGSFLYWCVMRSESQRFFIYSCLRILIISYLAMFLGTNSLSVLMCRKAVNQFNLWFYISVVHLWFTINAVELDVPMIFVSHRSEYYPPFVIQCLWNVWC